MSNDCYFSAQNLYSEWGSIYARGSSETQNVFTGAVAHDNVNLEHVIINGKVRSEWGHVSASFSKLAQVTAHNNIDLVSSSATDLKSEWGHVTVRQVNEERSEISSITAHNNVNIDRTFLDGRIRSEWGHVSANQSALGNVTAHNSIDLINSSAADLRSEWGHVTVKRTTEGQSKISSITAHNNVSVDRSFVDGRIRSEWGRISASQSKLGSVTAHNDIDLINSSASDLRSEWGNVTIRQTDGTQRVVSYITACNTVIAENSIIENITLHVNQDTKAILDLTNTKVSKKIVIKVNDSFGKITRIFFSLFSWPFWRYEEKNLGNESKHFSLLIKGTVMPENISFEGFDADEITSQMTSDGILVTGRKK